ncbi:SRPBCC family protein [bacterium AH-315-K03]|nr:SRPBCC family protein [bacterium AH-315-K03]
MMTLVEKTKTLNTGVEHAYRYISNMENYGAWFPGVIDIQSANHLEHGQIGKQYLETVEFPEGKSELLIEVVSSIKNKQFTTESNFPPLLPQMNIQFTAIDQNSCEIKWRFASRNNNPQEHEPLLNLIKQDIDKRAEIALSRLQKILALPK